MIYFDSRNPNKYAALKKLLVPHLFYDINGNFLTKKRYGKGDGSYVLCPELITPDSAALSYGIGEDVEGTGFERELAPMNPVFCYDPNPKSIDALWGVSCSFSAEALTKDNFEYHCAGLSDGGNHILKMDIEGAEYDWLTDYNKILLENNFSQLTIEVHGLIEEIPEGWLFNEPTLRAKKDLMLKGEFFGKINDNFSLFHIHANNHSPRYVDFPDSLELTYLRVGGNVNSMGRDYTNYPKEGLDEPNYEGREDYVLNWWI